MDNIPVTSVGSELISAGLNQNNPAMTTVDFADQMTKARQDQEAQEQAIARAKELTVQAGIQTANEQDIQHRGINPLAADYLTPEQASATLNLIFQEKGLPANKEMIQEFIDSLGGKPVERQVVEEFASRMSGEKTRSNQSATFTTDMDIPVPKGKSAADMSLNDMHDASGNSVDDKTVSDGTFTAHVPTDGQYQVVYNNQGQAENYLPGGKTPVDPADKANAKQANTDNKRWSDLEGKLQKIIASSRGNQLSSAVFRADRAINELADTSKSLAPQIVSFVGKDLSGIFQGGVPTVSGSEGEDFTTVKDSLNKLVQKYTGITTMFSSDDGDRRKTIVDLVTRLRDGMLEIMESMMDSTKEGYLDIINQNPERFNKLVADKMKAIGAGLTPAANTLSSATTDFPHQAANRGATTTTPAGKRPPLTSFNK